MTYAHDIPISDAFDAMIADFEAWIARRFAVERTLIVERESVKHWVARIGDVVLYRSPSEPAVLRFARTFADRTPGVNVMIDVASYQEHSVRVPDNVVALPARAEA